MVAGAGGGLQITAPPPPPTTTPINRGEAIPNTDIPIIRDQPAFAQARPARAAPVVILDEQQPSATLNYQPELYPSESRTSSDAVDVNIDIPMTLNDDGTVTLSEFDIIINDWVFSTPLPGTGSDTIGVKVDNYVIHFPQRRLTSEEFLDYLSSANNGIARSLEIELNVPRRIRLEEEDGSLTGFLAPHTHTLIGMPQPDGSIDVTLSIYDDGSGNLYFANDGTRTLIESEVHTFDLDETLEDETIAAPDLSSISIRTGDGYQVPIIITNLAKDGFGNARIVAADGTADSAPELLRIEADGVTGNVYAGGHRWYKDGVVIQGSTAHSYMATEAGAYHADVAIDIDLDGHADIWVETPAVDIA